MQKKSFVFVRRSQFQFFRLVNFTVAHISYGNQALALEVKCLALASDAKALALLLWP